MKSEKTSLFFVAMAAVLALSGSALATESPISYWSFDEAGGTMTYDSVGGNHGTIHGASWTTGIINTALSLDGVDDYVDCVGAGPLGKSPRTVCAWAKTSSTDSQVILSYGAEYGDINWGHSFVVGLCVFGGCEGVTVGVCGSAATYSATVADGEWHQYAFVVPSVPVGDIVQTHAVRIYQDGVLLTSRCAEFNIYQAISTWNFYPIHIGRLHRPLILPDGIYYKHFNGIIDEIALYDRALTDEEIWQLYQNVVNYRTIAINNIRPAITEKVEALERIDAALEREWAAYAALEEYIAGGDYGDLNKADIIRAKQDIFAAIQQQEQSKNSLEQSLQKLEGSLRLLGAEVQP